MHDHCGAFTAATGRQLEFAGRDKPRYRRYQYELIAPYCGRSILEVGAAFLATYGTMFVLKFVLFDRFIFVDRPARTPDTTSAP